VDDPAPLDRDDDPRAPHNFREEERTYPSASEKKKDLAVASKKGRPRPAAGKRPPAPNAANEALEPDVSPPPSAKKTDTLDLFNDTK
jgi:hypothetical protein